MGTFFDRYQRGNCETVWAELRGLGPAVRAPEHFDDASAVAHETMRRARTNVELIIGRLDEIGYRFWDGVQGVQRPGPSTISFNGKTIPAWPLEQRLHLIFEEAVKIPAASYTSEMFRELHTTYQLAMYPWRSMQLLANRLPIDAEATLIFERIKRAPAELTDEALRQLSTLQAKALEEVKSYWKERGEDPPSVVEQREKEERLRKESAATNHLTDRRVLSPPARKDRTLLRGLKAEGIYLPLSLEAWIAEVGDVNLAGGHPGLCPWDDGFDGTVHADPLMISPHLFIFELADWLQDRSAGQPLEALLGWDAATKAKLKSENKELDYGYTIELPDPAADCLLHGTGQWFVEYLRHAFEWGGFPGWAGRPHAPAELKALSADLLPI